MRRSACHLTFDLITTQRSLDALLDEAGRAPAIALDTEFERIRTYFPRLCLIQIAFDTQVVCIDALADLDLTPLWRFLAVTPATKVMHSGRQDLELVYVESAHALGQPTMPAPYVDTQIGAGLLGIDEQISYAALVEALLGVSLAKGHTRTDWTQRPLGTEQLDYAADDVRYLLPVWEALRERLEARARRAWVEEDSAALLHPALYEVDTEAAWRRVKGARRLPPAALAVLKRLAAWREREAVSRNKPRQWILRDDALVALAQSRPKHLAALRQQDAVPAAAVRRYGDELVALVAPPADAAETATPSAPPTPPDETLVRALMETLRAHARDAGICATSIASRREIEQFSRGDGSTRLQRGWRRTFIGEALEAVRAAHRH